jgi:hypoxanthine phosphoribosyltransferase
MSQPTVLLSADAINQRVIEIAHQINQDYADKQDIVLVGTLKGSFIFIADLCRHLNFAHEIDFLSVSSYGDKSQGGDVRILKDITCGVRNKHVIIIEDIIDTGSTLIYVKELFLMRHVASLKLCSLLSKPSRRKVKIEADYTGFEIDDHFVVGYGLDYAQQYRYLPYVGIVEPTV